MLLITALPINNKIIDFHVSFQGTFWYMRLYNKVVAILLLLPGTFAIIYSNTASSSVVSISIYLPLSYIIRYSKIQDFYRNAHKMVGNSQTQ